MVEGFRNPQMFAEIIDANRMAQRTGETDIEIPDFVFDSVGVKRSEAQDGTPLVTLEPESGTPQIAMHVVYFHGGGYVFPAVPPHFSLCMRLVQELGCKVTLPMYPLLPSASFRDILVSGMNSYEAIRERCSDDRIVLMGDSAGGSLSIAISQSCIEKGCPQPDFVVAFSPFVDLMGATAREEGFEIDDPLLDWYGSTEIAKLLTAGTEDDVYGFPPDPFFGPLEDLAPMMVISGTYEELYPGIRAFVAKLEDAGSNVEFCIGEGLHHAFLLNQGDGIPEVEEVMALVMERLRAL